MAVRINILISMLNIINERTEVTNHTAFTTDFQLADNFGKLAALVIVILLKQPPINLRFMQVPFLV
jgi:hypothetical protein